MTKGETIFGVGLLIGAFSLYSWHRRKCKPNIYIKESLPFGWHAMTLPPWGVFVSSCHAQNKSLLAHELIHWRQFQHCGLLGYYLKYGVQHSLYGYDAMPMEREARVNENEYCKDNYSECVREGHSKTVFDPYFKQ